MLASYQRNKGTITTQPTLATKIVTFNRDPHQFFIRINQRSRAHPQDTGFYAAACTATSYQNRPTILPFCYGTIWASSIRINKSGKNIGVIIAIRLLGWWPKWVVHIQHYEFVVHIRRQDLNCIKIYWKCLDSPHKLFEAAHWWLLPSGISQIAFTPL